MRFKNIISLLHKSMIYWKHKYVVLLRHKVFSLSLTFFFLSCMFGFFFVYFPFLNPFNSLIFLLFFFSLFCFIIYLPFYPVSFSSVPSVPKFCMTSRKIWSEFCQILFLRNYRVVVLKWLGRAIEMLKWVENVKTMVWDASKLT